jgi:hypothetical protein
MRAVPDAAGPPAAPAAPKPKPVKPAAPKAVEPPCQNYANQDEGGVQRSGVLQRLFH